MPPPVYHNTIVDSDYDNYKALPFNTYFHFVSPGVFSLAPIMTLPLFQSLLSNIINGSKSTKIIDHLYHSLFLQTFFVSSVDVFTMNNILISYTTIAIHNYSSNLRYHKILSQCATHQVNMCSLDHISPRWSFGLCQEEPMRTRDQVFCACSCKRYFPYRAA